MLKKSSLVIVALTALLLLPTSFALADSPTIVELPSQYTTEQVDALVQSIDVQQLMRDADKFVPGILVKSPSGVFQPRIGFHIQPLVFNSLIGRPSHMALRVDVQAPSYWGKEAQFKNYLTNYLEHKFPGAKVTDTTLH